MNSNLQRVGNIVNDRVVSEKVRANRRLVLVRELLENVLLNDTRLANTTR